MGDGSKSEARRKPDGSQTGMFALAAQLSSQDLHIWKISNEKTYQAPGIKGYISYGNNQFKNFDGQLSGHDFNTNYWHPPFGYVCNSDGGRSSGHWDYRSNC